MVPLFCLASLGRKSQAASREPVMRAETHWTETVYRKHALLLFDVEGAFFQNPELTKQEIAMARRLARRVGGRLDSPVIDIACGPGRHSTYLSETGHSVIGFDFSLSFLKIAAASNGSAGARRPTFMCGDMRTLHFADGSFGTALLLGNSFGYFSDEDNLRALREAYRVLRPGGYFCMEITNKEAYLGSMVPFEREVIRGRFFDGVESEWRKSWNEETRRVTTWERYTLAATGRVVYEGPYDVRLYDRREILDILRLVGFRRIATLAHTPDRDTIAEGFGETWGALSELIFIGARK